MITNILDILGNSHDQNLSNIPPTLLFNEGWMMRLVLNWFKNNSNRVHKLSIPPDCKWYSEALLPSPFLRSPMGKSISEGYTHADGVVGKFDIGMSSKGELSLKSDCNFFYVVEAKMFSSLSSGTKNATNYNQAARNIACIAQLLLQSNLQLKEFEKLGFYVLLPETHPDLSYISNVLNPNNIIETIKERVSEFGAEFDNKYNSYLLDKFSRKENLSSNTWVVSISISS